MPLNAQDRIELHELMARYAHAVDAVGAESGVFDIFTDDAELDSPASGRFAGIDGLRRFAQVVAGLREGCIGRHLITNVRVAEEGDGARVSACYIHTSTPTRGAAPEPRATLVTHSGSYDCYAVRRDGRWRLRKRTVTIDSA